MGRSIYLVNKNLNMKLIALSILLFLSSGLSKVMAQSSDSSSVADTVAVDNQLYKITMNDGAFFIGRILKQDEREIKIKLPERTIIIPQYQIKKIERVDSYDDLANIYEEKEDLFGNKYSFVPSALPLHKGEGQFSFSLTGLEYNHGITNRISVGLLSSWVSIPVVLNAKYTLPSPDPNINFAVGTYFGSGSWLAPEAVGALPFASITFGNRRRNFSITGGYAYANFDETEYQGFVFSGGGLVKISSKISLCIEAFYYTNQTQSFLESELQGMVSPAMRWQFSKSTSFQFGFSGFIVDEEIFPLPALRFLHKL